MTVLTEIEGRYPRLRRTWSTGAVAGFAGGGAEIIWIALYKNFSDGDVIAVARGVTESLFLNLVPASAAAPLGVAIHIGLAIILGVAIAVLVRTLVPRVCAPVIEPLAVVGLLVGVWATNFFLVLPVINPAFVALVPYEVSLISKVLFGIAAALVLRYFGESRRR